VAGVIMLNTLGKTTPGARLTPVARQTTAARQQRARVK